MKRFFFITGKGGVGKTSLALALTHLLHQQNKKVLYLSLDIDQYDDHILKKMHIPFEKITIAQATIDYITKRLKSRLIAQTLVKTPFYQGVANIVPGFENIILMGKIFEYLKDSNQYIVLDGPATGHALTTIESLTTFKNIFSQGIVFEDINSMADKLFSPALTDIWLASIPEQLIHNETVEFAQILKSKNYHYKIIFNKVLSQSEEVVKHPKQPGIIEKKLQQEQKMILDSKNIDGICPYFFEDSPLDTIAKMSKVLSELSIYE